MHRLVIFGPPGSGKGTQSKLLAQRLNLKHISTGDILRAAIANKTELGKQVEKIMSAGNLVSDEIVSALVKEEIENFKSDLSKKNSFSGFIFDGYPRTFEQVQFLEKLLDECELEFTRAIELVVPLDKILSRIEKRATENATARSDDSIEVAKKRYDIFLAESEPVLKYYRNKSLNTQSFKDSLSLKSENDSNHDLLLVLDGVGEVEEINTRILNSL